ncbi:hypothetical protein RM553_15850 [Zunongwangia sp. F363]|uniref:Uncharacterized protein n=1 Tax=Autumnicola tepida TaxID=3075595 RepID=A0ABU3CD89_9FLAO|nr:hypothetical protein [Zunongwangia sp. F363]MDT0644312.1 hypothetical protein [Zunongwangia sp. F363]
MNTEKIKTLEKLLDTIEIVENARSIDGLTPEERVQLEEASVSLRNVERSIIRVKTNKLVETLTADAVALDKLADEINHSAEKLAGVAKAIEKASNIVKAFVKLAAKAISAGLI